MVVNLHFLYYSNMSNTYSISVQKYSFQVEIHMSITSDTKTYTLCGEFRSSYSINFIKWNNSIGGSALLK